MNTGNGQRDGYEKLSLEMRRNTKHKKTSTGYLREGRVPL